MNRIFTCSLGIVVSFLVLSCTTVRPVSREYTPQQLFNAACGSGLTLDSISGVVLLRLKSEEISGQFPAQVQVKAPDHLRIEVTNFLGGTEAVITVKKSEYEILRFRDNVSPEKVLTTTWSGIPLQWAVDLFLGKIPCPVFSKPRKIYSDRDGNLTVESQTQIFNYAFKEKDGNPVPYQLHWVNQAALPAVSVDFTFDEFEKETLSLLKWEARSAQGGIKVRWKNRKS